MVEFDFCCFTVTNLSEPRSNLTSFFFSNVHATYRLQRDTFTCSFVRSSSFFAMKPNEGMGESGADTCMETERSTCTCLRTRGRFVQWDTALMTLRYILFKGVGRGLCRCTGTIPFKFLNGKGGKGSKITGFLFIYRTKYSAQRIILSARDRKNLVQIIQTSNYPNIIWYKIVKNTKSGPSKQFKLHRNSNYPCSN